MENMSQLPNSVYIAAIIGFLAGALIVWLMTRKSDGSSEELREEYDSLKKSHESYQKEVNAHFAKTADAIDTLTKSYQDVFSHLSQGAEKLMDKAALKAEVEKRHGKAVTLAYLTDKEGQEKPTPIPKESVIKESTPPTAKKESKPSANPEAKPSTKPTPKAAVEKSKPVENPVKESAASSTATNPSTGKPNSKPTPSNTAAAKPSTELPEKSNAQKAAAKAGLKTPESAEKKPQEAPLDGVKRHIRNNQPK